MKPTLLFATLSMVLASPAVHAKSELETLRALCKEQERQIHQLEDDNAKLRSVGRESQATPARSEPASIAAAPAKSAEPAPVAATTPVVPASYTVKAGDSFGKIARKVGTTPEKLAKANGLKSTAIIRPGQRLKVPGAPASASSSRTVAQAAPVSPKSPATSHKVLPGETFSSISKKHGMSTAALVAANPAVNPSALRPGQMVSLGREAPATTTISTSTAPAMERRYAEKASAPASKTPAVAQNIPISIPTPPKPAATPAPKPQAAPEPKPAVAESAPAPAPAASTAEKRIHPVTIEGEMTYGEFAGQHGTDTGRLNALNGLDLTDATVLAKGSELYVPAQP